MLNYCYSLCKTLGRKKRFLNPIKHSLIHRFLSPILQSHIILYRCFLQKWRGYWGFDQTVLTFAHVYFHDAMRTNRISAKSVVYLNMSIRIDMTSALLCNVYIAEHKILHKFWKKTLCLISIEFISATLLSYCQTTDGWVNSWEKIQNLSTHLHSQIHGRTRINWF